jgi:hypothetical protein
VCRVFPRCALPGKADRRLGCLGVTRLTDRMNVQGVSTLVWVWQSKLGAGGRCGVVYHHAFYCLPACLPA